MEDDAMETVEHKRAENREETEGFVDPSSSVGGKRVRSRRRESEGEKDSSCIPSLFQGIV